MKDARTIAEELFELVTSAGSSRDQASWAIQQALESYGKEQYDLGFGLARNAAASIALTHLEQVAKTIAIEIESLALLPKEEEGCGWAQCPGGENHRMGCHHGGDICKA